MKLSINAVLSYPFCIINDLNVCITRPGKAPQACNYLNYLKPDYTLAQYFFLFKLPETGARMLT